MNKYRILNDFENVYIHVCDIIGDKVTSNKTLNNLCNKLLPDFIGVYSADDTVRLKEGQCCIINSDPSSKSGTHWCALYKYKSVVYFFDSFARTPYKVSKYWKNKKWVPVEFKRIESYKSENCGELSVTFLLIFNRYKTKCVGVI